MSIEEESLMSTRIARCTILLKTKRVPSKELFFTLKARENNKIVVVA